LAESIVGVAYPLIGRHQRSGQQHEGRPGALTFALIHLSLIGAGPDGPFGEKGITGR